MRARRTRASVRPANEQVPFDDALAQVAAPIVDYAALDDALTALEANDPRKCRVVEMRFFGGMSEEETALALRCLVGNHQTRLATWRKPGWPVSLDQS